MSAVRRYLRRARTFALLSLACGLAAWAGFKAFERSWRLSHVPDAMGVTKVIYAQERSWGWGPGGNGTGIITYKLPDEITTPRLAYFQHLPDNADGRRQGDYSDWQETPITQERRGWPGSAGGNRLKTEDFLCQYGFCLEVDPAVLKQVDNIINTPGGFYARGRSGLIIVSPAWRLVVYLYAG